LSDIISEISPTKNWMAVAPTLDSSGVFMGSPVFDGAKEGEIKALLEARWSADFGQDDAARRHDREISSNSRSPWATSTC
jgi:hypothetical protein